MSRADFNIGNEVRLDVVKSDGTIIYLGGIIEFERDQEVGKLTSKPLDLQGRPIHRTIYNGWKGHFKFDRQSNTMDALAAQLEANYLSGGPEIYFQITETLRDPTTGLINQYQYEQCSVWMSKGGNFKADAKVEQTMEFCASTRTILI